VITKDNQGNPGKVELASKLRREATMTLE